jgi:hypothetical protein
MPIEETLPIRPRQPVPRGRLRVSMRKERRASGTLVYGELRIGRRWLSQLGLQLRDYAEVWIEGDTLLIRKAPAGEPAGQPRVPARELPGPSISAPAGEPAGQARDLPPAGDPAGPPARPQCAADWLNVFMGIPLAG